MNTKTFPFLNKYFHELEYPYLTWHKGEKYNDALLILDQANTYSHAPYIEEICNGILRVLTKYFTTSPIHKTNRINWELKQNAALEELLVSYIKPKTIITFSGNISHQIEATYPIFNKIEFPGTKIWKGLVKINDTIFSFYSFPDVQKMEELPQDLTPFIITTTTMRKKLCEQMNHIHKKAKNLTKVENPLDDVKVKKYLKNMMDFKYPSFVNFSRKASEKMIKTITDFDFFDILVSERFLGFMSHDSIKSPFSLDEYIQLRKMQSSVQLMNQYLEPDDISFYKDFVQLNLQRLYFYLHFPDLSFEAEWGMEMAYNMEMKDIIQGHVNAHKEMMKNMARKNI